MWLRKRYGVNCTVLVEEAPYALFLTHIKKNIPFQVVSILSEISKPISTKEEVAQVATISANRFVQNMPPSSTHEEVVKSRGRYDEGYPINIRS